MLLQSDLLFFAVIQIFINIKTNLVYKKYLMETILVQEDDAIRLDTRRLNFNRFKLIGYYNRLLQGYLLRLIL